MANVPFFLAFASIIVGAYAYSAGAPETVCDDMTPQHPVDPQTSDFPYKVSTSKKIAKSGEEIDILISGKAFKGFLLQVRNGDKAVGSFVIPDTNKYSKAITCHKNANSAATHKNSVDKKDLTLKWKAPPQKGNYKIYATVAEDGATFWVRKPVQDIKVN